MDNAKDIRNHIRSVRDTQKITNAMYLISSNKLRRAKRELDQTRPYFEALKGQIGTIFRHAPEISSRYIASKEDKKKPEDKVRAYLVITSDKGLAGAYNHNILRMAREQIQSHSHSRLYVVGEFGRQYFRQQNISVSRSFLYTAQNPTMRRARAIWEVLRERYFNGAVDEIYVLYTDMKNSFSMESVLTQLLPFTLEHFSDSREDPDAALQYEFIPSEGEVLDNVMSSYLSGYIYSVLVASYCSEQNARMTAMEAASRNADEILHTLTLRYNTVRQAAITQEITEISAGAKAQKRIKEAPIG